MNRKLNGAALSRALGQTVTLRAAPDEKPQYIGTTYAPRLVWKVVRGDRVMGVPLGAVCWPRSNFEPPAGGSSLVSLAGRRLAACPPTPAAPVVAAHPPKPPAPDGAGATHNPDNADDE
jgi:hypothetical protein